jgi:hypothetical protein
LINELKVKVDIQTIYALIELKLFEYQKIYNESKGSFFKINVQLGGYMGNPYR